MTKYHAKKTTLDGITFDSLMEARRYGELKLLLRNGEIDQLEVHPVYPLVVNDKRIGKYIADFKYMENGREVVEDVKGVLTAVYRLKKKLMQAIYGTNILETKG